MKFPVIQEYTDYRKYLEDFYKLNKKKDSPTSHRFLALKLKWPISYFNDVVKKRKNLTMPRALEFSKYAKMDLADTERLIYLIFLDSNNSDVQEYFKKKLQNEQNADSYYESPHKKSSKIPDEFYVVPEEIFQDVSLIAIYDVIKWANGNISVAEIAKLLYTFPELSNAEVMKKKLKLLEKHDLIKINKHSDEQSFDFQKKHLFYLVKSNATAHFAQYAENFMRICKLSRKIGWLNSGFVKIPRNRLIETEKRFRFLGNWLIEINKEAEVSITNESKNDTLIFQYDINLLSILNPTVLKIDSFSAWITK